MSEPFKKQIARYRTEDGRRCSPGTPGATRHVEHSRKWYGTVGGKAVPLTFDKQMSQKLLRKLLGDAELARHGLADPFASSKQRPLTEHLMDFAASIRAKGGTPSHVSLTLSRIQKALEHAKVVFPEDLDGAGIADYLNSLRADGQPVNLPEGQKHFRLSEVASLLGIRPG